MNRFARETSVTVERSRAELDRLLRDYKADNIVFGTSAEMGKEFVQFKFRGLPMGFRINTPSMAEERFHFTLSRRHGKTIKVARPDYSVRAAWEQACRQQWRVRILIIKAGLEAVESGEFKPEEALMPMLLLPNGKNMAEEYTPQIGEMMKGGRPPKMLMETFGGGEPEVKL